MEKSNKPKEIENFIIKLEDYKRKEYWADIIEVIFDDYAALSFAVGAELFAELIKEPGFISSKVLCSSSMLQLEYFVLNFYLPEQFKDFYGFSFYKDLKCRFDEMLSSTFKIKLEYLIDQILVWVIIDLGSDLLEEDALFPNHYDRSWAYDFLWDDDFLDSVYYTRMRDYHPYHYYYWFTNKIQG